MEPGFQPQIVVLWFAQLPNPLSFLRLRHSFSFLLDDLRTGNAMITLVRANEPRKLHSYWLSAARRCNSPKSLSGIETNSANQSQLIETKAVATPIFLFYSSRNS